MHCGGELSYKSIDWVFTKDVLTHAFMSTCPSTGPSMIAFFSNQSQNSPEVWLVSGKN